MILKVLHRALQLFFLEKPDLPDGLRFDKWQHP
jgi:hypothetical protein